MDNVTHSIFGLALARAGLGRMDPLATCTLVIASNFPDIDCLGLLTEDKAWYICNHRGITHALLGIAVMAPLLAALITAVGRALGKQPRLGRLATIALLGMLGHLALDSLNAYGVRPFLPFSDAWYYGDLAYIVDPWFLLMLSTAAALGCPARPLPSLLWWLLLGLGVYLMGWTGRTPGMVAVLWACALTGLLAIRQVSRFDPARGMKIARLSLGASLVYLTCLLACSRLAAERGLAILEASAGSQLSNPSTNPVAGIPWRYTIMAESLNEVLVLPRLDLIDGSHLEIERTERNLNDPLLQHATDDPRVRTWRSFARHPYVLRTGGTIVLADRRYSRSGDADTWCNLSLPISALKTESR